MQTPVLSKKQQKASLSAKKAKKSKTTIKNVLMTPYKKHWPVVSDSDQVVIEETLKAHLPRVAREKIKIPWKEFRGIPKCDHKNFRNQYYIKNSGAQVNNEARKDLHLGVNDTTKLLEENKAGAVLITSDVQPRLLVEHIIDQCILNNVPVLVVPSLRHILKCCCGVKSAVMAVGKNSMNSDLNFVRDKIECLAQNYAVNRDTNRTINSVRCGASKLFSEKKDFSDNKKLDNTETMSVDETDIKEQVDTLLQKLYLKRDSDNSKKRAFVPVFQEKTAEEVEQKTSADLFLPFSESTDDTNLKSDNKKLGQKQFRYHSLKVKKMKGDFNRIKKKVEHLKKKKN